MKGSAIVRHLLAISAVATLTAACRDGAEAADRTARRPSSTPTVATRPVSPPGAGWTGRYTYEYDGGKTVGGSAVIVGYTLTIGPSTCRLDASGFQTDETILCTTRPAGSTIDVLFRSYGDGATTDRYGNPVYSVGDPLFALERRDGRLLTRWKGYALPDEKPRPPGVFFRR